MLQADARALAVATSFEARIAGRLSTRFVLDMCEMGRRRGSVLDSLLLFAVIQANVGRLNQDALLQAAHARLSEPPPDELRRPVSINALALSLNQPFETVRRRINGLVELGLCAHTPQGVYVPTEVLQGPLVTAAFRVRYERFWRFHDELCETNVIEPLGFAPLPSDHPDAPVRAINRIISEYFFRMTEMMNRYVRDPLTGLLLLGVIRANSEHLPLADAAEIMRTRRIEDSERRPASVAELARDIGIPYETTRRHVTWLVSEGYCSRSREGVTITPAGLQRPALVAFTVANLANTRRMFRQALMLKPPSAPSAAAAAGM